MGGGSVAMHRTSGAISLRNYGVERKGQPEVRVDRLGRLRFFGKLWPYPQPSDLAPANSKGGMILGLGMALEPRRRCLNEE